MTRTLDAKIAALDGRSVSGMREYETAGMTPEDAAIMARLTNLCSSKRGLGKGAAGEQVRRHVRATDAWTKDGAPAAEALGSRLQALADLNKTGQMVAPPSDQICDLGSGSFVAVAGDFLLLGGRCGAVVWRGVSASFEASGR